MLRIRYAALVVGLVCAGEAAAQKPLRRELAEVAVTVAKRLASRSKTIGVGTFTCTSEPPTNHGSGIYLTLCEELTGRGLRIDRESRWQVSGTYEVIIDKNTRLLALKLDIKLRERDGTGGLNLDIAQAVVDEETVAGALGLTVSLPVNGSAAERAEELQRVIREDPPPRIASGRVSASKDSPYGIAILVKRDGKYEPVEPRLKDKVAYVPVARNEAYAVRLYNDSDYEAAASLTIDGIDLFAFCDVKPSSLIIPPKSGVLVRGWPITLETTNEFLVTSYARSAAYQLKSFAPVGVINAAFAAAWPKNGPRPPDELRTKGADATGHGAQIEEKYVAVERTIGVLRASVSVRYTKD